MRLTTIIRHICHLLPWTNLRRFLDGLNTLRMPDGTKISPQSWVAVCRSMQRTLPATYYARLEFQMSLLIASFKRVLGQMHWMEQPTILRWTREWLFHSLALEPLELHLRLCLCLGRPGQHRRLMEFKASSCSKARTPYFAS